MILKLYLNPKDGIFSVKDLVFLPQTSIFLLYPHTSIINIHLIYSFNSNLNLSLADIEFTFILSLSSLILKIRKKGKKRKGEGGQSQIKYLIVSLIFFIPSDVNNQNEKKGNVNASGKKRLISINRPAKAPNHSVLSTGATERYVFRSRMEKAPFLFIVNCKIIRYVKIMHI